MTAGRLRGDNLLFIEKIYNGRLDAGEGEANSLRIALQLIVSTPEFHTTNFVYRTSNTRDPPPRPVSNGSPYKAIVNLNLFGGMDSFYMLTPHHTCGRMWRQYNKGRGKLAGLAPEDMLPINAVASDQPCDYLGLNKNLANFREIYNKGHGIFFANTGHLAQFVTKEK